MEDTALVIAARRGDSAAFSLLVRRHQGALLALAVTRLRDGPEAEDAVQEAFVLAWSRLGSLRRPEAFGPWLRSIALNAVRARLRNPVRRTEQADGGLDDRPGPEPITGCGGWADRERLLAALTPPQRLLWDLRYQAGLSLRQIGTVLAIPENRVKSRLHSLRCLLARSWPNQETLKETIMDKIEALRLGAHVFERLSLAAQVELVRTVLSSRSFGDGLLAQIGLVDRGAEFLALYGTTLVLKELTGILGHVDRFTEHRLVTALETLAPTEAEQVKEQLFVFEDLSLFEGAALGWVIREDRDVFATALGGAARDLQQTILERLPAADRTDLEARLHVADPNPWLVRAAQEAVVSGVYDGAEAGRLQVRRDSEGPGVRVILRP